MRHKLDLDSSTSIVIDVNAIVSSTVDNLVYGLPFLNDIFAQSDVDLGIASGINHKIKTGNYSPLFQCIY